VCCGGGGGGGAAASSSAFTGCAVLDFGSGSVPRAVSPNLGRHFATGTHPDPFFLFVFGNDE
jgi:hypothetical protein